MARARGGSAGAVVSAVLFGILFVFALLAAIIFYTQQTELRKQAEDARKALAVYVTNAERDLGDVSAKVGSVSEKGTVVKQYIDEVEQLRRLAIGDTAATVPGIEKQMEGMKLPAGTNLIAEVNKLQATLRSAQEATARAEADLKTAREQVAAVEKQKSELAPLYQGSVQQISGKVDELATRQQAFAQTVQQSNATLEEQIKQTRTQLEAQVGERDAVIAQKDQKIADLDRQINELQRRRADVLVDNTVRPDGVVSSVVEGQPVVYIDLGRQRGLIAGMTFEVFEPGSTIKPDEFDEVRGKATIEVTNVEPHRATARIVRTERNAGIKAGDQVVNLAFDPNSVRRFYVYGAFDIENAGAASLSDRKRIEAMVGRFGGELLPELTYEADYLVLGEQPELPVAPPAGTTDPDIFTRYALAKQDYDRYQQLIGEARSLKIPILNQNRFLALMGYYER